MLDLRRRGHASLLGSGNALLASLIAAPEGIVLRVAEIVLVLADIAALWVLGSIDGDGSLDRVGAIAVCFSSVRMYKQTRRDVSHGVVGRATQRGETSGFSKSRKEDG